MSEDLWMVMVATILGSLLHLVGVYSKAVQYGSDTACRHRGFVVAQLSLLLPHLRRPKPPLRSSCKQRRVRAFRLVMAKRACNLLSIALLAVAMYSLLPAQESLLAAVPVQLQNDDGRSSRQQKQAADQQSW